MGGGEKLKGNGGVRLELKTAFRSVLFFDTEGKYTPLFCLLNDHGRWR
jgi:hypothetical protein